MRPEVLRGLLVSAKSLVLTGIVVAAGLAAARPAAALSKVATLAMCNDLPAATGKPADAKVHLDAGAAAFAGRKDPAKAQAGIEALESALAIDPTNLAARIQVSRLYYLLADGYWRLEGEAKEDAMVEGFEKGLGHAGIAVGLVNPALKKKICGGAPIAEVTALLNKDTVEPLYWFATHMGKYGLAKDLMEVLANKELIFGAMDKIHKLQPDFFYHAPDRYLASYYSKVPFPDGDPARSYAHFSQSIKGSPKYLATYVLMAELYAARFSSKIAADSAKCAPGAAKTAEPAKIHPCKSFFEKLLTTVLKADAAAIPELEAEQLLEQKKAQKLLEQIDDLF
jgi:hypothetical protein